MPKEDAVPKIDLALADSVRHEDLRRKEVEYNFLMADEHYQKIVNRDKDQRYWLRWIAAAIGIIVIVGMTSLLWHMMHQLKFWPFQIYASSVLIAMFVAPLVSITTVTIALFIGAFRRFSDDDLDKISVPNVANSASQVFGSN